MEGLGTKTTLSDYISILFLPLVLDLESIGLSFLYFFLQRGLPFIGGAHMCPGHCISEIILCFSRDCSNTDIRKEFWSK